MKKLLFCIFSGVVFLLITVLAVTAVVQTNKASELSLKYENTLIASLQEALTDMRTLENDLSKLIITVDESVISQLLSTVALKSAACGQALSKLPIVATGVQNTLKFTNQLSSYCTTVLKDRSDGLGLPENFDDQVLSFFDTCHNVNAQLQVVENDVLTKKLSLLTVNDGTTVTEGLFGSIDEQLIEYPSVIFDGPFSDGQARNTPKQQREPVTVSDATAYLADLGYNVPFKNEMMGDVPVYVFEDEQNTLQVTKNGGLLLMAFSERTVTESLLTDEQAEAKAKEFAQKFTTVETVNIWQEYYSNVTVFNFAPIVDGVIIYPDIFKIKVALDNGQILAFEGKSYIMNAHPRTFEEATVTVEQAEASLKSGFNVETKRLALISINEREQLTYEFFGEYNGLWYAIYISAYDGKEKTCFRIISTETGKMVV